jgi:hypothetical protein
LLPELKLANHLAPCRATMVGPEKPGLREVRLVRDMSLRQSETPARKADEPKMGPSGMGDDKCQTQARIGRRDEENS